MNQHQRLLRIRSDAARLYASVSKKRPRGMRRAEADLVQAMLNRILVSVDQAVETTEQCLARQEGS